MSQLNPTATPEVGVVAVPVRELAPWVILMALLTTTVLYFVGAEQGAVALLAGDTVHEWVHDGRHLLGFPCH